MTDVTNRSRQPKGVPIGGEFASNEHGEAPEGLDGDTPEAEPYVYDPTYTILPYRLAEFEHKVTLANRRLERAGIDERFTTEVTERVVTREGEYIPVLDVKLNKPTISAGAWSFVSAHERTANGDILSYRVGDPDSHADDPEVTDMRCDQCGKVRSREKVYLARNKDTGEVIQVGGSCLNIFTGVKPEGLWSLTNDLDVDGLTVDEGDDASFYAASRGSQVYRDQDMMLATIRAVAESPEGKFISKSSAGYNQTPTAERVKGDFTRLTAEPATPEEQKEIDEILSFARSMEGEGYAENVRAVFSPGADGETFIKGKHVGIAASAYAALQNDRRWKVEREAREAKRAAESAGKAQSYLAPPKSRIADILKERGPERPLRVKVIRTNPGVENDYGDTPMYVTMMDQDGHIIVWKASREYMAPEVGDTVDITGGSISENNVSDYNGDWETRVTRMKFDYVSRGEEQG